MNLMHRCIELFVPLLILLLQLEVDVCIAGITTEHVDQLQGAPVIVDLDNRTIDEEFPSSRGDEEYEASGDDPDPCTMDNDCESPSFCGTNNICEKPCFRNNSCCSLSCSDTGCGILEFCEEGDGDCYADHECQGSLVCGADNICREPCEGDGRCCSQGILGFCKEGEGDCDADHECRGSLVCGKDNCAWGGKDDCCRKPRGDEGKDCTSDGDCLGELVCGFDNFCRNPCNVKGAASCCSQGVSGYCKEGEGDCDKDSECEGKLKCGKDNCDWGGRADCCYQECGGLLTGDEGTLSSPNYPADYSNEMDCEWTIRLNMTSHQIKVSFIQFDIQDCTGFCKQIGKQDCTWFCRKQGCRF